MKSVSAQRDIFIASHAAGRMREMEEEEEVKRGMPSLVTQPGIAPLCRASVLTAERYQCRWVSGSGGEYKKKAILLFPPFETNLLRFLLNASVPTHGSTVSPAVCRDVSHSGLPVNLDCFARLSFENKSLGVE